MTHNNLPNSADGHDLPSELGALAAQLKTLVPRADRLDRERLMFLAGRAAAAPEFDSRVHWAWPAAFVAMTALAATLLVVLVVGWAGNPTSLAGREVITSQQLSSTGNSPPMRDFETGLPHILSRADVYHPDIEQVLATRERLGASGGSAEFQWPIDGERGSVLTPASWHQILNGS
jgi:hypothetical protein